MINFIIFFFALLRDKMPSVFLNKKTSKTKQLQQMKTKITNFINNIDFIELLLSWKCGIRFIIENISTNFTIVHHFPHKTFLWSRQKKKKNKLKWNWAWPKRNKKNTVEKRTTTTTKTTKYIHHMYSIHSLHTCLFYCVRRR